MKCFFLIAVLLGAALALPKALVTEYLGLQDSHCLSIEEINQHFFRDIRFYEVDNQCIGEVPPTEPFEPVYLAIDPTDQVYSIFGQKLSALGSLVEHYPLRLKKSEIRDYGWFVVAVTRTGRWGEYYPMTDLRNFLAMNRRLFSTQTTSPSLKEWNRIESQVTAFCDSLNLNQVRYDSSSNQYDSDYYIWYELGGDVVRVSLSISSNGMWEVISDTLVAQEVGCWTNLLY